MGDDYTDDTTDMRYRGGYSVEKIARRNNRQSARLAECGHCGKIVSVTSRKGTAHVIACERKHRPYQYGRR
jgi:hypothetical protein